MASIWRTSLISILALSFILTYGIHVRSTGLQLFHTINIIGVLAALLFNVRKMDKLLFLQAFPVAMLDYLYIFAEFSKFTTCSVVEISTELIFTNTALIFLSTAPTMTGFTIFLFVFFCFQIYKNLLAVVRQPVDVLTSSIFFSLTISRAMLVMIRSAPICFERFVALLIIAVAAALFNYQAVAGEVSHWIAVTSSDGTLHMPAIFSIQLYLVLLSLLVPAGEFAGRDLAIFAGFTLCMNTALYVGGYSLPYVWDYGIYSIAPRIIILLLLITIQFICLSILKTKSRDSEPDGLDGALDDGLRTPDIVSALHNAAENDNNVDIASAGTAQ